MRTPPRALRRTRRRTVWRRRSHARRAIVTRAERSSSRYGRRSYATPWLHFNRVGQGNATSQLHDLWLAEEDLPAVDPGDPQQVHQRPGVVRQLGLDFLLALGIDDQQERRPIAEWPAEDDEAVVNQRVHVRGVLIPAILLAQGERRVPARPPFPSHRVIALGPLWHHQLLAGPAVRGLTVLFEILSWSEQAARERVLLCVMEV